MKHEVRFTKKVEKQLKRLPIHIKEALLLWATSIEIAGLREVRIIKSYHDEPLKGKRLGERSVRLSFAYRAIYIEVKNSDLIVIRVLEVNKHEY